MRDAKVERIPHLHLLSLELSLSLITWRWTQVGTVMVVMSSWNYAIIRLVVGLPARGTGPTGAGTRKVYWRPHPGPLSETH